MSVSQIIIDKIRNEGPISFRDFMEMALYYPESGYYSSPDEKIGKGGDFFTSPYFTSLFGQMIGKQLEEMEGLLNEQEFTIVEYGAGTGVLCRDILDYLSNNKELYNKPRYCIIEKSPSLRRKQQLILPQQVSWYDSLQEVPGITGCILSNEVVDNFSVHQVVMKEELMEVFVDYNNGFTEVLKPASPALKQYLEVLQVTLPPDFRAEINLEAVEWIKELEASLQKGFVLTIDYGFPSAELYSGKRRGGTLVCYHKHQINYDPYRHIGEQDITAHVNFSALCYWGLQLGLQCCGFTTQSHFLRALGLVEHLKDMEAVGKYAQVSNEEKIFLIRTLLMDMGSRLKVLIQQKGVQQPTLSGLKFSQPLA